MLIKITDKAKQRFNEQLKQRGKGIGIIVGVKKTGCSGYAYTLEFAEKSSAENHLTIHDGLYVWVTKEAYKYLDGMTIDYVKQGLNEKFEFINPNESGRCGCGESFTV
jgi:iron-sulfur cluster assembly protein